LIFTLPGAARFRVFIWHQLRSFSQRLGVRGGNGVSSTNAALTLSPTGV
jgi:hypothetical protein